MTLFNHRRPLLGSTLLCVLLSACSTGPSEGTGGTDSKLPLLWSIDRPASRTSVLLGSVIVGQELNRTETNLLQTTAIDLNAKQTAWVSPEPFVGRGSVVWNGALISVTEDGFLWVRGEDGRTRFRLPLPDGLKPNDESFNAPKVQLAGELLVVPLGVDLLAYRAGDVVRGEAVPVWRYQTPRQAGRVGGIHSLSIDAARGWVVLSEHEYAPTPQPVDETRVRVLNLNTGALLWSNTVWQDRSGLTRRATVGTGAGQVLVHLDGDAHLTAYGIDGQELWQQPQAVCPGNQTTLLKHVLVQEDTILPVSMGDHCLTALNHDGSVRWVFQAPGGGTFAQEPLILNGVLYATNGRLWALDLKTGAVLGQSAPLDGAQNARGVVLYDAPRHQLLIWAKQLWAFRPVR